jgi:hypothetical protein
VSYGLTGHRDTWQTGSGDFSKEKKSGTKSYKGNKQGQGLKPCRQLTVKVDAGSHKESAGEKCNSRDLPTQAVVIEPEGAPILDAKSDFRFMLPPWVAYGSWLLGIRHPS